MPDEQPEYLSYKEAAAWLSQKIGTHCSHAWVRELVRAGKLRLTKFSARKHGISKKAIEDFLKHQEGDRGEGQN